MANTAAPSCCPAAIIGEVERVRARGQAIALVDIGGQCYSVVEGLAAPVPPWDRAAYDILVAIPLAAGAALDGFYLALPYQFRGGSHPRVNGGMISFDNRDWQLVSWHYPDGRPWTFGADDLDTHITHCKGFFLDRGAVNAIS